MSTMNGEMSEAEERAAFGGAAEPEPAIVRPPALNLEHANGALFAAIAKAQAEVGAVTKSGFNRDKEYAYATADSMIRGAREARSKAGGELALVTSWTFVLCDPPKNTDSGQWPGALVTVTFALMHAGGGYITGTVEGHAICSRGRPIDKAVTAAVTYLEGFVERGLMRLDREKEGADDVDTRKEQDTAPARPRAPQQQRQAAAPAVITAPINELIALIDKVTTPEALAMTKENAKGKWQDMNKTERAAITAAMVRADERTKPAITGPQPAPEPRVVPAGEETGNGALFG